MIMRAYDFEQMDGIWKSFTKTIITEGIFVAENHNWDLWCYSNVIYCIPVKDSGCGASTYCHVNYLKKHLHKLRRVIGYSSLIPDDWEQVNYSFLSKYGIY